MDPNTLLKALRSTVRTALEYGCTNCYLESLAEQINDLDEWLSKGGFLPEAWRGNGRLVTQHSGEMKIIEDEFNDSYDDGGSWTVWTEGRSDD